MASSCKIKDRETGLYSRGGMDLGNLWGKLGKTWSSVGALKAHLRLVLEPMVARNWDGSGRYHRDMDPGDYPYGNCEVVISDFEPGSVHRHSVSSLLSEMLLGSTWRFGHPAGTSLREALAERFGEEVVR